MQNTLETLRHLKLHGCHRPAYWSQTVIGMWEPVDDRRNGAKA
jgi:hypothetical protein